MSEGYLGYDNTSRKISSIYIGVEGKARLVKDIYVGVNGVARKAFPFPVTVPSVSGEYIYNRETQKAVISRYDKNTVTVTGTTEATDAGTYTVTFTLKAPYERWADGTTAPKSYAWVINPKMVAIPTVTGNYNYSGTEKRAVISSYDENEINVSGITRATNAGTYEVVFNLSSTRNYKWADNSTTQKKRTWLIDGIHTHIEITGSDSILAVWTSEEYQEWVEGPYEYNWETHETEDYSHWETGIRDVCTQQGSGSLYIRCLDPNNNVVRSAVIKLWGNKVGEGTANYSIRSTCEDEGYVTYTFTVEKFGNYNGSSAQKAVYFGREWE